MSKLTRWLFQTGEVTDSKVMLIFGSSHHEKEITETAISVADSHGIEMFVISGYRGESEKIAARLHDYGISLENIYMEVRAENTKENICNSLPIINNLCTERELHILCKLHALPRTLYTTCRFLPGWKVQAHSVNLFRVNPEDWWENEDFFQKVASELAKIQRYQLKGDLRIPDYVDVSDLLSEAKSRVSRITNRTTSDSSFVTVTLKEQVHVTVGDLELVKALFELKDAVSVVRFPATVGVRPDAVAVLAYDSTRDLVVTIDQFRPGPFMAERRPYINEVIAGYIDEGETPNEAAVRELLEETNLKALRVLEAGCFYPAPTLSTEKIYLRCAIIDSLEIPATINHGLEKLRCQTIPAMEFLERYYAGGIDNALTNVAAAWLSRFRPILMRVANYDS